MGKGISIFSSFFFAKKLKDLFYFIATMKKENNLWKINHKRY
jgi:hypothetical protein